MENMNFIDLQDALRTQPDETLTSIKDKGAALLKSDADNKNALRGYFEAERRMGIRR